MDIYCSVSVLSSFKNLVRPEGRKTKLFKRQARVRKLVIYYDKIRFKVLSNCPRRNTSLQGKYYV